MVSCQPGRGKVRFRAGPGRLGRVCASSSWHTGLPSTLEVSPIPGGLTQHAFAQASQAEVGSLEGLAPLLVQRQLLALDEDGATALQHALRSPLHHQHVPRVPRVLQSVDGQLRAGEGAKGRGLGEGRG